MLTAYLTRTTQLLQNPAAPASLYSTTDLTSWINVARGQLAGETACVRALGTIPTVIGTRNYNFSGITGLPTGVAGATNVRGILYGVGSGFQWMRPRPWQWYFLFKLNNPVPENGPPEVWSQFGQGSAGAGSITGGGTGTVASGSFYIDPPPDAVYLLTCDCECYPAALTADTEPELIPYLFTDAVPYFAAYLALMSAQTNIRLEYAKQMLELYGVFVQRAMKAAAPGVNRYLYEGQGDGTGVNKLGVQQSTGGGQQQ